MSLRPVYSAAFIEYTSDAPNASFEVPPGYTAVIRQVSAAQNIGGWTFAVVIQNSEIAPELTVYEGAQDGAINYVAQEGRWVCPGGGIISVSLSSLGSSVSVYVGGYLLVDAS